MSHRLLPLAVAVSLVGFARVAPAVTNLSVWVIPSSSGRMLPQPDPLGNRVLDHSQVGYRNGLVPIPDVPVKATSSPVAGDDGANIQAAINTLKALPLDANGFRGAVLLTAGEYQISNSITIDASGVILRGVGDGSNGTILRAAGTGQRTLVFVSGSGSRSYSGTARNITNNYVPVGARGFNVDTTSGLAVGDRVTVLRPSPTNWINDIGMNLLDFPWTEGSKDVESDRIITRIEGNRIILDAPLTCALEKKYGGGTIRKFTWSGRINHCGIEDLRGVSDHVAPDDEDHGWVFIHVDTAENCWVRRVTSQYFGYACVELYPGARTTTVRDCKSLDPVSIITGSRRYAFPLSGSALCLVQNCYTDKDRHQFVTHSLTHGPHVFVDGLSDNAYNDTGPHHRWATGAIWDNVTVNGHNLNVQNRGNSGTGHGWAGANEVVWNSKADGFIVQNPPTARNWLIGSIGPIQPGSMWVGPHDPGTYDSHGSNVFPNSLYYAQLQDRLAAPSLQTREYWIGEINQFTNSSPTGTVVTVDAAWRTQIQALAAGAPVNGFDIVTNNQFVPFTFNFTLGAADRVVAASFAISMRAYTSSTNETLYLDSTNSPLTFSQLNWLPIGTGTNTTVRVLDLGAYLNVLADGRLNLAVSEDVGIDWVMLELQVAPVQTLVTNFFPPLADATVRGGVNAGVNYGDSMTLDVKLDGTADNQRQAYLRWHLAGYSTRLQHARVRLTPVSVGTNGIEHGVTLANSSVWSESTINWNNQPGGGKRFATWIPATNGPVEFVVTPQAQAALNSDGQFALELFSLRNVGGPGLVGYASSEDPDPAKRPQLLLVYSNALPVISAVADQWLPVSGTTGPMPFTIGDPGYAVNLLTLAAISSNTNLLPTAGLVLGGSLSNRTITVTPAIGQTGTGLVTLVVTNPAGYTVGSQFAVTVTNTPPSEAGASGSWLVDASGDWNNPANWSGGIIATGADFTATFAINVTASRFVNNSSERSIGNLVFDDANSGSVGAWFITNQPITLQHSNGAPAIVVSNTTATINAELAGAQNWSKSGNGTLVLAGANTYSGATTLSAGPLRATHDDALGAVSGGTSIGNDPTARLELTGDITLAEPLTISCKQGAAGNVPAVVNVSGTNTLAGAVSLTTGGSFWTFEAAVGKLRVTGMTTNITTTNVRTIWLRGNADGEWLSAIGDSAAALGTAIRKDDSGTWAISGANTYTGNTVISNGTLLVNGVIAGGAVNVTGGTLGGNGVIKVPVTLNPGATLSPGTSTGTLTLSNNLTLAAGSTTFMEINAQTLTNDHVRGLSNLAYAGTLVITNVVGLLAGGQNFKLFSAAGFSGNFTSLLPGSPGPNLTWSFNPADGTLSVASLPPPQITGYNFSAGGFALSGTGPIGQSYRVLMTTNLDLPLASWSSVATGSFSGGLFDSLDSQATNFVERFYRVVTP